MSQTKTLKVQKNRAPRVHSLGAASHWHGLEGCTMCDISGNMLKNNKAVMNLCALISWKNSCEGFM